MDMAHGMSCRGATRDTNLGISEEELGIQLKHEVEVGAEVLKGGSPEVVNQSYYAKQGEYRALGASTQESQEWSTYVDDDDNESSDDPNEQPLSTADESKGKNLSFFKT